MEFNLFKKYRKDKAFYKTLFAITIPIVLQNLVATAINLLDTVMIGNVGEKELAAVGIANQFYFLFNLTIFGVAAGCGVFIAQLWGTKDVKRIKSTLGFGLISGFLITLVFSAVAIFFPKSIMQIFSKDFKVIEIGSDYLIIAAVSYIFTAISFSYSAALRSIRNTSLPMWASLGAFFTNGILNYILIFGKFGFAPLGVKGAAIATLIARAVEVLIILGIIYTRDHVLRASIKELGTMSKEMVKTIINISTPVILNDICFGLATVTYSAIYGRISTEAIAAVQIATTVFSLFTVIIYGLANSAVVVVGNEIGAGNTDKGIEYANRITGLSVIVGFFLALLLATLATIVPGLFNVSEIIRKDVFYILIIYSVIMIPRVFTLVVIVGVFRGGGECVYGGVVQGITSWLIGIPLAYIAAHVLHLPITTVVMCCFVEEIARSIILYKRYKSYKWIRIRTGSNQLKELLAI
ncbi:MAG: MATE family efflux transporter [Fusobacteriaceae bacterium]